MPRRYLPRRRLDESSESELTSTGTGAPVLTDERASARLTELLITRGPEGRDGKGTAVPPTSVARLQRLAGNRAVADRLGGSGRAVQRSRNRASDEEEPIPEPAQAGPVEAAEAGVAPPAQAGPVEAAEAGVAPPAQAGPVEAAEAGVAPPAQAGPVEAAEAGVAPPAQAGPVEAAEAGVAPPAQAGPVEAAEAGVAPPAQAGPVEAAEAGVAPPAQAGPVEAAEGGVAPPAQAGPVEAAPGAEGGVAPPAQAGPVEAAEGGVEAGVAPPAQAGPVEAAEAPNAEEAAKAGIEESAKKPVGVTQEPTGLDKLVEEKVAPIAGAPEADRVLPDAEIAAKPGATPGAGAPEADRVLPDAEIAAKPGATPGAGAPEADRVLPDAEIAAKPGATPGAGAPEADRVLPDAEIEAKPKAALPGAKPGAGAPEADRVLPDAEIEAKPKAALPGAPEGGSTGPVDMPGPTGGGGPGAAVPGIEMPAGPTPEPAGPGEPVSSEVGPAPTAEPPESESIPGVDLAQIAILNVTGGQAAATALRTNTAADKMYAVAVSLAGVGFATALRQAMSRAVQWRSKILGVAPLVVGKAAQVLTGLRTTASTMIQNLTLKVKSVADSARGVLAWARQALSAARGAARGIANKLRSTLGSVGEAVLGLLSSLLAPARNALDRLLKAGSDALLDGIRQVRVAAAGAVAFVKEQVGTVLDAALAIVVQLVREVVKIALEQARRAMDAVNQKVRAARAQLQAVGSVARAMLFAARSRAGNGIVTAIAVITTAMANGSRQLTTGRGRRAFRQYAKLWQMVVRGLRTRAKVRFASSMASVKLFERAGKEAIGASQAEARESYGATRTSLKDLETTAVNEAGGLGTSVGEAAKVATGAIDAAVTEGETLIREVAGEGEGDARELRGLINRSGQ